MPPVCAYNLIYVFRQFKGGALGATEVAPWSLTASHWRGALVRTGTAPIPLHLKGRMRHPWTGQGDRAPKRGPFRHGCRWSAPISMVTPREANPEWKSRRERGWPFMRTDPSSVPGYWDFCPRLSWSTSAGPPEMALSLALVRWTLLLSGEPLRSLFRTNPSVNMFWNRAISNADIKLSGLGSQKSTKELSVFVVLCPEVLPGSPLTPSNLGNFVLMTRIKIVELIPTWMGNCLFLLSVNGS